MRINFRVRDPEVIAYLEALEARQGRGAKSRACNVALEALLGYEPPDEGVLRGLKALIRQLIGISTNLNQITQRAHYRDALSSELVTELESIRDRLRAIRRPLEKVVKRWSR